MSLALGPWCKPLARHDPGKIATDLAVALALGRDWPADVAVLRGQPGVFGLVASDPTMSRLVDTLAADCDRAVAAIDAAVPWPSTGVVDRRRRTRPGTMPRACRTRS